MKYSIEKTSLFDKWLSKLKDRTAKTAIIMRIMRAENGNFGDVKSVGTPVQEMRIFVSKGYRIYFTVRNHKIIILLNGGHKGTQQQDIDKAHKLLIEMEG
ncbi:MAG: type II toxin-antitoxin system RelE/ParE family toxin [Saccharospirillaceae bacterium]|nr:type II toxin-antitoxin system RelE/ParE family toxin [Saccharospirillaceae bacterium]